jgi:SAM-dependent methyltransferase
MALAQNKAAELGNPSFVWRFGQDRRLSLIRRYADLENRRILDIGCGIGTYVKKFREFSPHVSGVDIDFDRVREGARSVPNLVMAVGEHLPYRDEAFDVVLLNEVIEHVRDDHVTMQEAVRVTRKGGHVFIYAPNRLYPFETHGIYLGKRYVFGNIPLANYLPGPLRSKVIPHARAYLKRDIRRVLRGLDVTVEEHTFVYPGFDNIVRRSPLAGGVLRRLLYRAEHTPLRNFGLSHFVVLRRNGTSEAEQA